MPKKKKIKIGLTMGSLGRIWTNGLDQNVVFLAKILKKAGFEPYLCLTEDEYSKNVKTFEGIKLKKYSSDLLKDFSMFDVLIYVSNFMSEILTSKIKENNTKIIMVSYGYLFQIFNEAMAGEPSKMEFNFERYAIADAVWISPHFEESVPWYDSFCNAKISICPYVWDPLFFDKKCKEFDGNPEWSPEKNIKRIAIHEPNINYLKTCVIPLSIAGSLNRTNPELIDNVIVLNTSRQKELPSFINYVKSLDLVKKGSFETRRTTPFMAATGQMGLSLFNQINCALNYLPLELMRLGYPVVHNSEFYKSAGYFYPGIDVAKGAEQLKIAIETHEENYEEKLKASMELVHKHSMDNEDNVNGYKRLIEEVLDS